MVSLEVSVNLNSLWTAKDFKQVNTTLKIFFENSSSLFADCLDLIEFSKDKRRPKSLGHYVIDQFTTFLHLHNLTSACVSTALKERVLHITLFAHAKLSAKLITCFGVDKPSLALIKKHIKNLNSNEENLNAAISLITALHLQDEFSIYEVAVPIFMQNKLNLLEPYMAGSEKVQLEMFKVLDSFLCEGFDMVTFCANHGIRSMREEVLRPQFQEKILTKWLKHFSKEGLAEEIVPNLCKKRALGVVKYILYRYYVENSSTLDNFIDLMKKNVKGNECLQDQLFDMLQYTYQDYEALDIFKELFGRKENNTVISKRECCIESEEDWGSSVDANPNHYQNDHDQNISLNTQQTRFIKTNLFHSLKLPRENVIMVDDNVSLQSCISTILDSSDVVGIDAEWLFSKSLTNTQSVALLQLATKTHAFLLDLIHLVQNQISISEVICFLKKLFTSMAHIKLGYGLREDLKKLSGVLGIEDLSKMANRLIDFHSITKHIQKLYPELLTSNAAFSKISSKQVTGLSKLVLQTVGLQLDKSEQISDWERRPLREAQIIYAALDAYCLLEIYDIVTSRLSKIDSSATLENIININPSRNSRVIGRGRGRGNKLKPNDINNPINTKKTVTFVPDFRVVCDTMLQGLGRQLRCCGIDTIILSNEDHHDVAGKVAQAEKRIILTSGSPFQTLSSQVPIGKCLNVPNDLKAKEQLQFILQHYSIKVLPQDIFSRCQLCNCDKYLVVNTIDMQRLISQKSDLKVPWEEFRRQINIRTTSNTLFALSEDETDDESTEGFMFDINDTHTTFQYSPVCLAEVHPNYELPTKVQQDLPPAQQSNCSHTDATILGKSDDPKMSYVINPKSISQSSKLDFTTSEIVSICERTGECKRTAVLFKQVPQPVCQQNEDFYCCINCGKVYWEGFHFKSVIDKFKDVIS